MIENRNIVWGGIAALVLCVGFFLFLDRGELPGSVVSDIPSLDAHVVTDALILGEGFSKYTHPLFDFSLEYPSTLIPRVYDEGDGAYTLVFKDQGEDSLEGFQIFIHPFPEEAPLTGERIREDVPGIVIKEEQTITLADGVYAFLFWGRDSEGEKTREVWFVSGGMLYEVTAYSDYDATLSMIMATLRLGVGGPTAK